MRFVSFVTKWLFVGFCHLNYVVGHFELVLGARSNLNKPAVAGALQMLEDGATQRTVAEGLRVSRCVVARPWIRFHDPGRYSRKPGQGRGRAIITTRQDR